MIARQLALPFAHSPDYAADGLLAASCNESALAWLNDTRAWPQHRLVLWGPAGSGKTHMLHAWAARHAGIVHPGPALRFAVVPGPLAIDDADAAPETALLHMLNAAAEAGHAVLLAARAPPSRWGTILPDLASRLRSATAVQIEAPDDALLAALLARLLAERQLAVAEPVQDWLRLRLPRDAAAMREAAARLDRITLGSGSRIGRVAAACVLADMAEMEDDGFDEQIDQPPTPGPAALLL